MLYREGAWYLAEWERWREVVAAAARGSFHPLLTLPQVGQVLLIERWGETPPDNLRLREPAEDEILYKFFDQSWWCEWKATVDWRLEADEIRRRDLRAPFLEEERHKEELLSRKLCPPDDEPGWIYVAQPKVGGPIKLGWTLDVKRRMKRLGYEYETELVLLDWTAGTKNDELQLHRALRSYMLPYRPGHGVDWFRDTQTVRRACEQIDKYRSMRLEGVPSNPPWDDVSDAMVFGGMERRDTSRPRRRDADCFRDNGNAPKVTMTIEDFFIEDPTVRMDSRTSR